MKTKTPYLDFYYSCMKTGRMPKDGLCRRWYGEPTFTLFSDDWPCGSYIGYNGTSILVWLSGVVTDENCRIMPINEIEVAYSFTPLRQTIVLLCAAINGEL